MTTIAVIPARYASERFPGKPLADLGGDFGDGEMAQGVRVSHTYARGGRYLISLSVTNDKDFRDRERQILEVQCPSSDIAPWTFGAIGDPQHTRGHRRIGCPPPDARVPKRFE